MENVGSRRKVRFNLPDFVRDTSGNSRNDHSTSYLNGTLISISGKPKRAPSSGVLLAPASITFQLPTVNSVDRKPTTSQVMFRDRRLQSSMKTVQTLSSRLQKLKEQHIVIITDPPRKIRQLKSPDTVTICNRFSRLMLVEDVIAFKPRSVVIPPRRPLPFVADATSIVGAQLKPATTVQQIAKSLFNANTNSAVVADLVNRWHRMRYRDCEQSRYKSLDKSEFSGGIELNRRETFPPTTTVSIRNRLRSDVRRSVALIRKQKTD